jgi:hypothetical protein
VRSAALWKLFLRRHYGTDCVHQPGRQYIDLFGDVVVDEPAWITLHRLALWASGVGRTRASGRGPAAYAAVLPVTQFEGFNLP